MEEKQETPFERLCKSTGEFADEQVKDFKKNALSDDDVIQVTAFLSAPVPFTEGRKNKEWVDNWLAEYFDEILDPYREDRLDFLYGTRYKVANLTKDNFKAYQLLLTQLEMEFLVTSNTLIGQVMKAVYKKLEKTSGEVVFQFLNPKRGDLFEKGN